MSKRRKYLLLLAGIVALAVVALLAFGHQREPEYGGRKLRDWVLRYDHFPERGRGMSQSRVRSDNDEAMQHMGVDALPYLLEWIRYEPPPWKEKLWSIPMVHNVKLLSFLNYAEKIYLARGAVSGLVELGPQADAAIPALTELIEHAHGEGSMARAAFALDGLGRSVNTTNTLLRIAMINEMTLMNLHFLQRRDARSSIGTNR